MNVETNNIIGAVRYEPSEKAQELCEKLYLAAKNSGTRRFHALYDKVYRMDRLTSAWNQVKANRGTSGNNFCKGEG